ncbi:ras and EF-hand domain-containing protein homolog isoform X2 [Xenia sp. Carnegie-2017]|uniref:ras and EF-hand domain-containing protein homolog isoform X2 n=1 Tax=Xenia sp. Carnegie-2017 TaxID=2897299 RepID=UPI001F03F576|nr:ras and EF-hand domain-containing protein homolog isoform X2 [Xenia sp. Carnegie-2017]
MKIFFSNHRNKHRTHFKPTTLVQPKTISGLLVVGISFLRGTTLYVITDKSELAAVSDLNEKEVDEIFRQLDLDNDGRISVEEFSKSFQNFTDVVAEIKSQKEEKLADSQKGLLALKNELGKEGCIVTSKQYVSELYHNLSDANKPDLLDLFEKHLGSVVEDIKSRTAENQRLEEALKRATHQHAKQVHNLDREVEQQMERLEAKVRQEEKSFFEKKLADYKLLLESKEKEISAMSNALETLETKLDNETKKPNFDKDKYENVTEENRFLKSQVIDSQTTLALLRSEMAELKSQFVEQSDQLQKEQNTVQTFVDEQEHLTRQLKLLHEANQRLQDINDELRAALEERRNSSAYQTQNSLEVMKLSGLFSDVNDNEEDLPLLNRRNTFPRKRRNRFSLDANPVEFHNNTLNEDSLFTEINHASTPVKSALIDEEDEKSYETLTSTSHTADVKKQIQILEDTNKRLGNSNDELRTALKMLARSASFRKPKRSSSLTRRAMSSHSDYSSLSSNRSSRSFSPKKKSSSNFDVGEATDESTTYDVDEEERIGNNVVRIIKELLLRCYQSKDQQHVTKNNANKNENTGKDNCEITMDDSNNYFAEMGTEIRGSSSMFKEHTLTGENYSARDCLSSGKSLQTNCKSMDLLNVENISNVDMEMTENLEETNDFHMKSCNSLQHKRKNDKRNEDFNESVDCYNNYDEDYSTNIYSNKNNNGESSYESLEKFNGEYDINPDHTNLKEYINDGNEKANETADVEKQKKRMNDVCKKLNDYQSNLCQSSLGELNLMKEKDSNRNDHVDANDKDVEGKNEEKSYEFIEISPTLCQDSSEVLESSLDDENEIFNDEGIENNHREKDTFWCNRSPKNASRDLMKNRETTEETNEQYVDGVENTFSSISEEESISSSEEETSDSTVDQIKDSSATMNSETIAELNTQIRDEMIEHKKQMIKSNSQSRSDLDDDDDGEEMNSTELAELVAMASDLTDITDSDDEEEASYCTPERMYKLVLAGDAAVGKSSFILRLCKNKFHSSLNATLGVDFQVKNVKVDSKTIALQLWDTAGQERFRSIAKSYFRKVDGVLLLYDVTCESSFVHIRDWIATIEECSHKKVPIMICANKCDLREEYIKEGRKVVTKESGLRLAKYYDALFIEISAKDGHHIEKACKDLSRILTSLENEEIEQSGLKLERKEKDKKKLPCCTS